MNLSKKKIIKYLLMIISTIIVEVIFYYIADIFGYRAHLLTPGYIDNLIPQKTIFIFLYIYWYIMLIKVPLVLAIKDNSNFKTYINAVYICLILALIVFIVYPTIMIRDDFVVSTFADKIFSIVLIFSTPTKCSPSMHVALCTLFIIATSYSKKVTNIYKLIIILISLGIILSTLFTKQHYFIDVVTGIIAGSMSWIITIIIKKIASK